MDITTQDRDRFYQQRRSAKFRGVKWDLTLDQWVRWWEATGHYSERGKKYGQYVMGRRDDIGPYRLDNIVCVSAQSNSTAPHRGTHRSRHVCEAMRKAARRGSAHGCAKLHEDKVRQIHCLANRGVLQRQLAAQFGVSQPQISQILHRRAWRHC